MGKCACPAPSKSPFIPADLPPTYPSFKFLRFSKIGSDFLKRSNKFWEKMHDAGSVIAWNGINQQSNLLSHAEHNYLNKSPLNTRVILQDMVLFFLVLYSPTSVTGTANNIIFVLRMRYNSIWL